MRNLIRDCSLGARLCEPKPDVGNRDVAFPVLDVASTRVNSRNRREYEFLAKREQYLGTLQMFRVRLLIDSNVTLHDDLCLPRTQAEKQ